MSEPRVRTISLPTLDVAALSWGPEDGPLALCLHGFPDTAWTWRHLGPALADRGWRVVAPFTRGYAPTGPAADGDYRVGALMTDALELRHALAADGPAVLVGHDWGAVTAHAVGAHAPDAFGRIVTMAVPPLPAIRDIATSVRALRADGGLLARQAPMSWYMAFNQVPVLSERLLFPLVRLLWRRWSPGYDATEDLAHLRDALPDTAHRSAVLRYYRHAIRPWRHVARNDPAHADWLRAPQVPTRYLHGATDGCMTAGFVPRARRYLPAGSDARVVAGAGHFLHLERPGEVNALVAEFLGDPPRS